MQVQSDHLLKKVCQCLLTSPVIPPNCFKDPPVCLEKLSSCDCRKSAKSTVGSLFSLAYLALEVTLEKQSKSKFSTIWGHSWRFRIQTEQPKIQCLTWVKYPNSVHFLSYTWVQWNTPISLQRVKILGELSHFKTSLFDFFPQCVLPSTVCTACFLPTL